MIRLKVFPKGLKTEMRFGTEIWIVAEIDSSFEEEPMGSVTLGVARRFVMDRQ